MSDSSKSRMVWFDANRVCAAMGVVLIHSTADFGGNAFPKVSEAERLVPVALRSIAEISSSEMFFFFSLFLLASKLDRKSLSYGSIILDQARRLLVPFFVWTIFYAFFRLLKADTFNYAPYIWEQLSHWQSWVGYFVLGNVQFHMHFLPTVFILCLFYPVMKLGMRFPIVGLAVFPTLAIMHYVQIYLWQIDIDPLVREYLLRAAKVMGYVGYGFAAFALYGLWKYGIARGESKLIRKGAIYFVAMAYLATLPHYGAVLMSGKWGAAEGLSFFGHFLMPIFVFSVFLGGQHETWSPRWSKLVPFTFGVYLMHPMMIDLYDVAVVRSGLTLSPWQLVVSTYIVVLPTTFLAAYTLSRFTLTAWLIGLGPAPWQWTRVGRPVAAS